MIIQPPSSLNPNNSNNLQRRETAESDGGVLDAVAVETPDGGAASVYGTDLGSDEQMAKRQKAAELPMPTPQHSFIDGATTMEEATAAAARSYGNKPLSQQGAASSSAAPIARMQRTLSQEVSGVPARMQRTLRRGHRRSRTYSAR